MKYLFIFLITYSCIAQFQKPIFDVKPDDKDFLRYFFYSNDFEKSEVTNTVGEFKLLSQFDTLNIPLSNSMSQFSKKSIRGDSAQGIDTNLQGLGRTTQFGIPNNGIHKIQFYRALSESFDPCDDYQPPYEDGDWDIMDRTEFAIHLMDAIADTVISVLDSAGSNPNNNPNLDARYGINPSKHHHIISLPANANGKQAYIRISPKRYGETLYGILMKEISPWVNNSSIFDENGNIASASRFDSLEYNKYLQLCEYIEEEIELYDRMPQKISYHPKYKDSIANKYFKTMYERKQILGDSVWVRGKTFYSKQNAFPDDSSESMNINLYPNPLSTNFLTVEINSNFNCQSKISLHNIFDNKMSNVSFGSISKGINKIVLNLSDYPSGTYMLKINRVNVTKPLIILKLVIAR